MSPQQRSPTLHYSSWYRLKKAVTVYMRVTAILKERRLRRMNDKPNDKPDKLNEDRSALTVQELEDAKLSIIRFTQFQSFEHKLRTLKQASNNKFKHEEQSRSKKNEIQVRKTSSIYRLDPFVDKGILSTGGRLNKADIPEE